MGKRWKTWASLYRKLSLLYILSLGYYSVGLYPGLAWQNRLKEALCALTVLFVYLVFSELSRVCVQFSVYNNREVQRQVPIPARSPPGLCQASGFLCFCFLLFRIVCVMGWGLETGESDS